MKTICLNMIVKNERDVIRRSLASVKELIDYWVIVDTGSTDGTQQIIKEVLSDIPGELHEQPWVNFRHNRNAALKLARDKADYILFIDADERFIYSEPRFDKNSLEKDFYYVPTKILGTLVHRTLLISNHPGWYWKDVLHEYLTNTHAMEGEPLLGVVNDANPHDGARSKDPDKFYKDIELLKKAIEDEPENPRYPYYLAQSYGCTFNFASALEWFEKRSEMSGGEPEEIYWSLYSMGCLQQDLQMSGDKIVDSYTRAYEFDPARAESLLRLANHFLNVDCIILGYLLAQFALGIPKPVKVVRVGAAIYDYRLLLTLADSAYLLGKHRESYDAYRKILTRPGVTADIRATAEKNAAAYEKFFKQEKR